MFLQSFSHVGFRSIWENLISASDGCSHTPGKPKRFSLATHVHATIAPWRMSAIGADIRWLIKAAHYLPSLVSAQRMIGLHQHNAVTADRQAVFH